MANNDLIAVVTYNDDTQETMRASAVDLQQYGYAIKDIILKDPDSGIINIDNGEQVEYGEPRSYGNWICVQGLWMYFYNPMTDVLGEETIYGNKTWNQKDKIYTAFTLPEHSYLTSNGSISGATNMQGNYTMTVELQGSNRQCRLNKNGTPTSYQGYISNKIKKSGSPESTTTLERFGLFFNVISFTDEVTEEFPYGHANVQPRWVGYDTTSTSPTGTAATANGTNWITYYSSILKSGSGATQYRSYVPMVASEGPYIMIPFKNENERNYAIGITHTYKKMSKQEYKDYVGL